MAVPVSSHRLYASHAGALRRIFMGNGSLSVSTGSRNILYVEHEVVTVAELAD